MEQWQICLESSALMLVHLLEKHSGGTQRGKYESGYWKNGEWGTFCCKEESHLVILINRRFILKLHEVGREKESHMYGRATWIAGKTKQLGLTRGFKDCSLMVGQNPRSPVVTGSCDFDLCYSTSTTIQLLLSLAPPPITSQPVYSICPGSNSQKGESE